MHGKYLSNANACSRYQGTRLDSILGSVVPCDFVAPLVVNYFTIFMLYCGLCFVGPIDTWLISQGGHFLVKAYCSGKFREILSPTLA